MREIEKMTEIVDLKGAILTNAQFPLTKNKEVVEAWRNIAAQLEEEYFRALVEGLDFEESKEIYLDHTKARARLIYLADNMPDEFNRIHEITVGAYNYAAEVSDGRFRGIEGRFI